MGNNASRDALEGKGAVVTGANAGIGLAVTKKLLEYGMVVVGIDSETDKLDEMKKDKTVSEFLHVIQSHISDEEELLDAFQWVADNVENVDVFINSAEIVEPCNILDGSKEQWQGMANVNILGMVACTVEMIRMMKDQKINLGLIIMINSVAGHEMASSSAYNFYSATKHAAARLALHLKDELEFTMQPVKITNITVGPNEFLVPRGGYENEESLQMNDITSAIDYVIHTPSHMQVRHLHIILKKED